MARKKTSHAHLFPIGIAVGIGIVTVLFWSSVFLTRYNSVDSRSQAQTSSVKPPYSISLRVKNIGQTQAKVNVLYNGSGLGSGTTVSVGQTASLTYNTPNLPVTVKADSGNVQIQELHVRPAAHPLPIISTGSIPSPLVAKTSRDRLIIDPFIPPTTTSSSYAVTITVRNADTTTADYNLLHASAGVGPDQSISPGRVVTHTFFTPNLPAILKINEGKLDILSLTIRETSSYQVIHQTEELLATLRADTTQDRLTVSLPKNNSSPTPTTTIQDSPSPSPLNILHNGGFEQGTLAGWKIENCCSYSQQIVSSPTREGSRALQSTLLARDPIVALSKRAEVKLPAVEPESEYWYAVSIYIPNEWIIDTTPEIVAQWHSEPDFSLGENWRNPPLALLIDGDHWRIVNHWDHNRVTPNNVYDGSATYLPGKIEIGTWTDWKVHARWRSSAADGRLRIWKNGLLVVDKSGPNTFNDSKGPYFKMGIYKFAWKDASNTSIVQKRTLYHDRVIVTKGPNGF